MIDKIYNLCDLFLFNYLVLQKSIHILKILSGGNSILLNKIYICSNCEWPNISTNKEKMGGQRRERKERPICLVAFNRFLWWVSSQF